MKQCPHCGTAYTDESLSFCLTDGIALVPMGQEQATVVRHSADSLRIPIPTQVTAQQYLPATQFTQPPAPAGSAGMTLKILLAAALVLVLLLVAIGAVGALLYFNSGGTTMVANGPQPTPTAPVAVSPTPLVVVASTPSPTSTPIASPTQIRGDLPQPSVTPDKEQQLSEVYAIEKETIRAAIKGDLASLSANTTDDFTSIDVNGRVHSKKSVLAESRSATNSRNALFSLGKADLVSSDSSTVVIRYTLKVGMPQSEWDSVKMTETYIKQGDKWLLKQQRQSLR